MFENHDDDRTQSFTPLIKNTVVGHYQIIEKIGSGGMGEVYLAEDTELDRKVALKFLPPHLCQDEDCRKRFKREAQAAAKLSHPNIVTIHEVGDFQGRPFFAMEHIAGRSLRDMKGEELDLNRVVGVAIQLCDGLQTAHAAGVTHRDIKPSNIVIDSAGRPKLLDFGLATVKGGEQLTKTGSTLGTVGYMSPEQIEGKAIDARSDVFSLGVVLYELIANKSPFRRDDETATLKAILNDTPEPLARYKADVPDDLQRIITKLLEKDPTLRYQSAAGVIPDLKKLSPSRTSSIEIEKKHDWWNRYIVPAAVAVILVMLGIWYFGDRTTRTAESDDGIRLAVLPFENLGQPEDEYFADGMTDEITAKLAGIGGLRVTSRTSAVYYKGSDKPLKDIARELDVDYILEGTVRWDKSGDTSRVRIIPQLIRAFDDSHIWASTIERTLTQVFVVQADIAEQVVTALNVNLLGEDKRRLQQIPTTNMEAYDYYLRGREHFQMFYYREDIELALGMFEKAVNLDTAFVSAYAELSKMHSFMYWFGWDRSSERSSRARSNADRALALDSNNTSAHVALGYYYYYFERDFDRALSEFEYAAKNSTNDADILASISYIKRRQGEWEESYQNQTLALELDPLHLNFRTALIETAKFMRRFDIAESIARKGLKLLPDQPSNYLYLGDIYIARDGDVSRALRILDSIPSSKEGTTAEEIFCRWWYACLQRNYERALTPINDFIDYCSIAEDTAQYLFYLAETYHLLNQAERSRVCYDSARVYLEALEARGKILGGLLPPSLGLVYSRLGQNEEAIQAARRDSARLTLSDDTYLGTEPLVDLAVTYARVGELDKALDLIDTLLAIPSEITVPILKLDPDFDPLRDIPRFQALIEKYEKEHGI